MTMLNGDKDYLFGLSANMHITKTHSAKNQSQFTPISSGMVWETCTILPNISMEINIFYFIIILNFLIYIMFNYLLFIRCW